MRNEFDMFNDIENDIDSIVEIELSEAEKKNISSRVKNKINNKRKFNKRGIVAAVLGIVLVGSLTFTNEDVLAAVKDIGRKIESFFEKEDDVWRKYKTDILQVSEDKGIKFMLHEVILDDEELYISASIDYKEFDRSTLKRDFNGELNIIPSQQDPKFDILVNGEKMKISGAGGSYEYNNDGTVDMLLTIDAESCKLDDIYDVKLKIDTMEVQIPNKEHEFIDGNWELDFNVDGKEILKESRGVNVNEVMELEHKGVKISLDIQEVKVSPLAIRFKYKVGEESWQNNMHVEFDFFDENNKKINFVSQGGGSDGMSYKYMIDKNVESIEAVPKIVEYKRFWTREIKFKDKAINIDIK